MLRFFRGPILFAFVCLALGAWYGLASSGTFAGTSIPISHSGDPASI